MKRKIRLLPALLAVCAVCAGCAGGPPARRDDGPVTPEPLTEADVPEIALAEDGKTDFRLVYDVDVSPELRNLYFNFIRNI